MFSRQKARVQVKWRISQNYGGVSNPPASSSRSLSYILVILNKSRDLNVYLQLECGRQRQRTQKEKLLVLLKVNEDQRGRIGLSNVNGKPHVIRTWMWGAQGAFVVVVDLWIVMELHQEGGKASRL